MSNLFEGTRSGFNIITSSIRVGYKQNKTFQVLLTACCSVTHTSIRLASKVLPSESGHRVLDNSISPFWWLPIQMMSMDWFHLLFLHALRSFENTDFFVMHLIEKYRTFTVTEQSREGHGWWHLWGKWYWYQSSEVLSWERRKWTRLEIFEKC